MELDFIITALLLLGFVATMWFYVRKPEGVTDLLFITGIIVLLVVVIHRDFEFAVPLICLFIIDEIRRVRKDSE